MEKDIGYESGGWTPECPFSVQEMESFGKFEYIIRQTHEVENNLNSGSPQEMWWVVRDDGGNVKSRSLLWKEAWGMVETMRRTSLDMYTGHDVAGEDGTVVHIPGYVDDPRLRQGANQILARIHQEREQVREAELLGLDALWNQP